MSDSAPPLPRTLNLPANFDPRTYGSGGEHVFFTNTAQQPLPGTQDGGGGTGGSSNGGGGGGSSGGALPGDWRQQLMSHLSQQMPGWMPQAPSAPPQLPEPWRSGVAGFMPQPQSAPQPQSPWDLTYLRSLWNR